MIALGLSGIAGVLIWRFRAWIFLLCWLLAGLLPKRFAWRVRAWIPDPPAPELCQVRLSLDQSADEPQSCEGWLNLGDDWRLYHRGSEKGWEQAIASYTKGLILQPTNSDLYRRRADTFLEAGQPERALQDAHEAIRHNAQDSDNFCVRAAALLALQDPQGAIQDLDRAIRLEPSANNFAARAHAHMVAENYDAAISDWTSAINRAGEDTGCHWLAYRGTLLIEHSSRFREGIEDLSNYLNVCEGSSETYQTRALAWRKVGDLARAEQDEQIAAKLTE